MVADLTGLPVAGASMLDEATAAAEAMTLLRRAGRSRSARFVVDADTLPQTLDVLRTRAEPLGIELVITDLAGGLPGRRLLRRAAELPGRVRRGPRPAPADRGRARARRPGRGGRRPARAHPAHPARRAGRGRAVRQQPAVRGPARLRRAARRLPVGAGEAGPAAARPAGRDVPRRRRAPRVAARPADPGAAHPPGEGDLEHLHRAGAAGRGRRMYAVYHGPDGLRADRRAHAPDGRGAGRRAARRRGRAAARRRSSTPCGPACPGGPRRWSPPRTTPGSCCAGWTPTRSASPAPR